jgi:hypothetical protein
MTTTRPPRPPRPSRGHVVQDCSFVAHAGKPQPKAVAESVTALSKALVAQSQAVSDLAAVLKGTAAGTIQTGITMN